ncbi:MAG TPA: hypothetical protein DDX98_00995 [Bacteroidales bacterium]|jgi:hypothetical protein|nr:hypothetical protein [Bacteroidales bacterium]
MYHLSPDEISLVSKRLKADEINYSHLFDDLLDHVCCDIEGYINRGMSYQEASEKTYKQIGLNGLKEIQEATIFYVKLNLIVMKKLMNVLAVVGTSLLVFGFFFKAMHWPGGSMLFFLGSLTLFLGFFPTALLGIRKELKLGFFSKEFAVYVVGFIALFVSGAAILFSMMHWPGARYLIVTSWVLLIVFFFPMLFYRIIKSGKNKIVNVSLALFSFAFMGFLIVSSYNNNTNVYKLVEVYDDNETIEFYKRNIDVLEESGLIRQKEITAFTNSLNAIESMIEGYKKLYLDDKENLFQATIDYMHYGKLNNEHDNGFQQLKGLLNNYKMQAESLAHKNVELQKLISDKLSTSDKNYPHLGPTSWERRFFWIKFGKESLYINLNKLLKDVYMVHYEILRVQDVKDTPEL